MDVFHEARMADAKDGTNDRLITLIELTVDAGEPFPTTLPNSAYLYADDYFRHLHGMPLRKRAAGQYYLDDDRYPSERALPYESYPVIKYDGGCYVKESA